ncbi:hypothetical protein RGQ29_019425 [Quercus rubra]|uniref:Stigma-specific Stig1 family protein n=1 Tax=Quercus rubra TaxID=3512 RepID=A0AAN7FA10_QUERU|nr:hypothetical protein RGQ29_019425 [Quercus rubra]
MAMNSSKIMLTLLVLTMSIAISLSTVDDESHANIKNDNANEHVLTEGEEPSFRFLAQQFKAVRTCEVYPKLCHDKNRPGPNCYNKQCVNLMTNKLNCGKCGKNDERHCGQCNNKCSKRNSCEYGLCSYAN